MTSWSRLSPWPLTSCVAKELGGKRPERKSGKFFSHVSTSSEKRRGKKPDWLRRRNLRNGLEKPEEKGWIIREKNTGFHNYQIQENNNIKEQTNVCKLLWEGSSFFTKTNREQNLSLARSIQTINTLTGTAWGYFLNENVFIALSSAVSSSFDYKSKVQMGKKKISK